MGRDEAATRRQTGQHSARSPDRPPVYVKRFVSGTHRHQQTPSGLRSKRLRSGARLGMTRNGTHFKTSRSGLALLSVVSKPGKTRFCMPQKSIGARFTLFARPSVRMRIIVLLVAFTVVCAVRARSVFPSFCSQTAAATTPHSPKKPGAFLFPLWPTRGMRRVWSGRRERVARSGRRMRRACTGALVHREQAFD